MYELINGIIINKNTNKKIAEFKNQKTYMYDNRFSMNKISNILIL